MMMPSAKEHLRACAPERDDGLPELFESLGFGGTWGGSPAGRGGPDRDFSYATGSPSDFVDLSGVRRGSGLVGRLAAPTTTSAVRNDSVMPTPQQRDEAAWICSSVAGLPTMAERFCGPIADFEVVIWDQVSRVAPEEIGTVEQHQHKAGRFKDGLKPRPVRAAP